MGNIPEGAQGRIGEFNRHLDPGAGRRGGGGSTGGEWKIMYTLTDEAPLLATYSLLPIVNRFTKPCGIAVEPIDISVAHRVLHLFPERLRPDQRVKDTLGELGALTNDDRANMIKLPNVSASLPQLNECIKELQSKGYDIPSYDPENPELVKRFSKVLGSAVNPVLREGNSDRRVAKPVKDNARVNPHRMIKPYPNTSKSKVVHMTSGDFYGNELSAIVPVQTEVTFELVGNDGSVTQLRPPLPVQKHEVIDASVLNVRKLREFLRAELLTSDTMVSLHLKATMMKVSDPIMFGHAVEIWYEDVFNKHNSLFQRIGVNPNNGIGDVYTKLAKASPSERAEVEADIMAVYKKRPDIAMVNSDKGITNLHVPSDVIIDASMPVVVRDGGKMWGWDNKLHDVKCIIPDRCYATMYKEVMDYCKRTGAFDPSKMGSVSNVGLMARKAEEYGSHDKTFEMAKAGKVLVKDVRGKTIFDLDVEKGDIFRMCQAKDDAIIDWISLALKRGEVTGDPVIFWLDEKRAHDASMIDIIRATVGSDKAIKSSANWDIMAPEEAMKLTLDRSRAGKNTISATGNVLRDYLTDLFPILELGTSAKMLSIVPLLAGGGLYETGAGGSAPKHVEQFVEQGHLRWDSLGEFLALAVSLQDLGEKSGNKKAKILGDTLNIAVTKLLANNQSPSRKVNEIDNRGSHFFLALYWASELVNQVEDADLSMGFIALRNELVKHKAEIEKDLLTCQGRPQDIGGYWYPDPMKAESAMRPSRTLNGIIDN